MKDRHQPQARVLRSPAQRRGPGHPDQSRGASRGGIPGRDI